MQSLSWVVTPMVNLQKLGYVLTLHVICVQSLSWVGIPMINLQTVRLCSYFTCYFLIDLDRSWHIFWWIKKKLKSVLAFHFDCGCSESQRRRFILHVKHMEYKHAQTYYTSRITLHDQTAWKCHSLLLNTPGLGAVVLLRLLFNCRSLKQLS